MDRLEMNAQLEKDKEPWIPHQMEREEPVDGTEQASEGTWLVREAKSRKPEAPLETIQQEMLRYGVWSEPELPAPATVAGLTYIDQYPTRFFYRDDVRHVVRRTQTKFPNLTYANTYLNHPPVYGHTYERQSADFWGGGILNGQYVGYRGKDINLTVNGWDVANALFNDPHLPNIYWLIHAGRMWTRGYGWGPSPYGPAGSDAGHYYHVHVTYL